MIQTYRKSNYVSYKPSSNMYEFLSSPVQWLEKEKCRKLKILWHLDHSQSLELYECIIQYCVWQNVWHVNFTPSCNVFNYTFLRNVFNSYIQLLQPLRGAPCECHNYTTSTLGYVRQHSAAQIISFTNQVYTKGGIRTRDLSRVKAAS